MGNYNVDLTPAQTIAEPIKVIYTFTAKVDPRAAMVIAADFGAWLADKGYADVTDKVGLPALAAEFIEQWGS